MRKGPLSLSLRCVLNRSLAPRRSFFEEHVERLLTRGSFRPPSPCSVDARDRRAGAASARAFSRSRSLSRAFSRESSKPVGGLNGRTGRSVWRVSDSLIRDEVFDRPRSRTSGGITRIITARSIGRSRAARRAAATNACGSWCIRRKRSVADDAAQRRRLGRSSAECWRREGSFRVAPHRRKA